MQLLQDNNKKYISGKIQYSLTYVTQIKVVLTLRWSAISANISGQGRGGRGGCHPL